MMTQKTILKNKNEKKYFSIIIMSIVLVSVFSMSFILAQDTIYEENIENDSTNESEVMGNILGGNNSIMNESNSSDTMEENVTEIDDNLLNGTLGLNNTMELNKTSNETQEHNLTENETVGGLNITIESDKVSNETISNFTVNQTDDQTGSNKTMEAFTINESNITGNESNRTGLHIKQWYPKGTHYVFVCDISDSADSYDWYYGDGHKLLGINNRDTYHIYENNSNNNVKCVARVNGVIIAQDEISISAGNVTNGESDANGTLVNMNFTGKLEGSQEVPSVATNGSGVLSAIIINGAFFLEGNFTNLSSALHMVGGSPGHIHHGAMGMNGPVAWPINMISTGNGSGTFSFTANLSNDQIEDFLEGNYYVNIHTENYPSGEIREQLFV